MEKLEILKLILILSIIIFYLGVPILILFLVRNKKRKNRELQNERMQKNHCIIGCKNCNAQQCPNNPNYIRKLL